LEGALSFFWWIAGFAACVALTGIVYWNRRTPDSEPQLLLYQAQRVEPRLLATYDRADEIEVIEELDGSFHVCSAGGAVIALDRAAATQIHRWFAFQCLCSCSQGDNTLTGYEIVSVLGGAFALTNGKNTTLVFDQAAAIKLHVLLRPVSCPCGCVGVAVPLLR
jgi:hypothetical protein